MGYEQREMSGSLFVNDRREKDTHPHYKGTVKIAGIEYWISAWTPSEEDKASGKKYRIGLAFQPKEVKQEPTQQEPTQGYVPPQPTGF